jgi:hypothetical protein
MTLAVLLLLRESLRTIHPEWLVIVCGLALGQVVFIATAAMFGLDSDDKLIISAIRYRVQLVFGFSGANA